MFNNKQEEVIDRLLDATPSNINTLPEEVLNDLVECNNMETIRFSSYVLSDMWNNSEAVKDFGVPGKTAGDFMSHPKWLK